MLDALQRYLRAVAADGRTIVPVGPFTAYLHPDTALPHASYALPDAGARPTPQDAVLLREAFVAAGRVPRLELLPGLAPEVEPALAAAGFAVEGRLALMACAADAARSIAPPPGVTIDPVAPDTALARALVRTQHVAFGETPDPDEVDRGARALTAPAVAARSGGEVVGGGQCLRAHGGVTELVGIAVAASHRRRGVAVAVTSALLAEALAGGVRTAMLTPGDEATGRVYARAGFATVGEMLHLRAD